MKRIFYLSIYLLLVVSVVFAEHKEKTRIAVASNGKTVTSSVSGKAARCPYYLIYSGDGKFIEAIANPHKDTNRRAGILATDFLVSQKVTGVIAETFGYKMINALKQKNIAYYEMKGKTLEVIEKVLKSKEIE